MGDAEGTRIAALYRETRERVTGLVSGLDEATARAPVPACPGWSVRDVLAHLAAVAEDSVAGRLTRPPTEEETAAQVARFADRDVAEILAAWADAAPKFEEIIGARAILPGLVDVVSHEHDIRAGLGRPGERSSSAVRYAAERLLRGMRTPVPLRVAVEDAEFLIAPGNGGPDEEPELSLTTTRYEALRWRMGRRSRAQLAAMDWSADPAPVLDHLAVFGPAASDVIE
ncbi:MAG: maleylpyruvate isomerase family mycothiol-dependent enzyme [Nocardiopsaceae bacterium]|nr:maleylpyruvate isomerase family mycothiol-dependent enzyme [Nocardiopsaceae bacterium]